jgi:hypothetical protein
MAKPQADQSRKNKTNSFKSNFLIPKRFRQSITNNKNFQSSRSNSHQIATSYAGIVINVILAIFTASLYYQAVKQNQNAANAVAEAKRANDYTKESLNYSKESTEAIVSTLKESQRQFEISNDSKLS